MVPEIVMDRLEVPLVCAGLNIDCDHGVPKQIGALAVTSVIAANRRSQRQVQESSLLVECEIERPGIHAETVLPALAVPGVVTDRSRLGHRAEFP